MASQSPTPLHAMDMPTDSEEERVAAFDAAEEVEPVQPSAAARHRALGLVGRLPPTRVLVGGAAAVIAGGAVGYWLGARHIRKPVRKAKRSVSSARLAVEMAPVAMQLLANPAVRSLLIRVALRRLAS